MHCHAMRRGNLGGQSGSRQVPLLRDPAGDPVLQGGQLAMPAAIALGLRRKAPLSFINLTMSLTNLTETLNRAAVDRRVFPSATWSTTLWCNSTGCGLPIVDPHVCLTNKESRVKPQGNPESR